MATILIQSIVYSISLRLGLLSEFFESVKEFLNWGLHLGEGEKSIHITVGLLLILTLAFLLTSFVLKSIRNFITRKMEGEDKLKFVSIFKFIKYVVYITVILITMSAAGINITVLITASAVLFVGLGLALQELFQDIIGGVFIIVDKSLQVGDVVEVDGKVGKVVEIKLRTTLAITRDDKVIIMPNHKFMSDVIYNHTQNHKTTREEVKVGVAYGSDTEKVTAILLKCISEEQEALKNPAPFVLFDDFGDSALLFSLHFYIKDSFQSLRVKSRVRYAIDRHFREASITIPFPQRDVHFYPKK